MKRRYTLLLNLQPKSGNSRLRSFHPKQFTCCPRELQTQVLQSTELRDPGTHTGVGVVVVVDTEPGHEAGHVPSLPATCSPCWVVRVLHQLTPSSTVVQVV